MSTLKDFLKNDSFAARAGAVLTHVSDGCAHVILTVKPEHLNAGGVCQGGALFTMADLAFAAVANCHKKLTFSITSNIIFHKSAVVGDELVAEAHETFAHHKLPCCEVVIRNQRGEQIATFMGTGYRKDVPLSFDTLE